MVLNTATVIAAVQEYLDKRITGTKQVVCDFSLDTTQYGTDKAYKVELNTESEE